MQQEFAGGREDLDVVAQHVDGEQVVVLVEGHGRRRGEVRETDVSTAKALTSKFSEVNTWIAGLPRWSAMATSPLGDTAVSTGES